MTLSLKMPKSVAALISFSIVGLVGCSGITTSNDDEYHDKRRQKYENFGKLFGDDTLSFGGPKKDDSGYGTGIGVNAYMWRATLDTLSFMPLKSVDPFGGVIITDWYTPAHAPHERLKVDVIILDRQLRADGLRVSVFRQELKHNVWQDAVVNPKVSEELENSILTRARELKIRASR